jgi:VanZ family protein
VSRVPEYALWKWIRSRHASVVFLVIVLLGVLGLSLNPHPEAVMRGLSLSDKVEHFAAYVVLCFFAARSFDRWDTIPLLLAVAACTALGGLIEVIQPFVGRRRELLDFLMDLGGAAVGALVASFIMRTGRSGAKR